LEHLDEVLNPDIRLVRSIGTVSTRCAALGLSIWRNGVGILCTLDQVRLLLLVKKTHLGAFLQSELGVLTVDALAVDCVS